MYQSMFQDAVRRARNPVAQAARRALQGAPPKPQAEAVRAATSQAPNAATGARPQRPVQRPQQRPGNPTAGLLRGALNGLGGLQLPEVRAPRLPLNPPRMPGAAGLRGRHGGGRDDGPVRNRRGGENGPGMELIQRLIAQRFLDNAKTAQPLLKDAVEELRVQADTNAWDPAAQANFVAGRMGGIDQALRAGQTALTSDLADRGLLDSSAMASGLGQLQGQAAAARAAALGELYAAQDQRQQLQQALYRDTLQQMFGQGGSQGAAVAGSLRQQQIAADAADPGFLSEMFGGLTGLAGTAGRMGWRPFGLK